MMEKQRALSKFKSLPLITILQFELSVNMQCVRSAFLGVAEMD